MAIIENFAALSAQEQQEFAKALIKTINSESIFTAETDFEITGVEADDLTGGLVIEVSHSDPIEVEREATWQASDEDEADRDPGYDADYKNSVFEDAKKSFKTLSTVIDGYKVSLDIADLDETETVEITTDHISHEDSGIGHYEYWGERGYDSHPYVEVEGIIIKACDCALAFTVEPDDTVEVKPEAEEEN